MLGTRSQRSPNFFCHRCRFAGIQALIPFSFIHRAALMLFARDVFCMYGCKSMCSKEADAD